MYSTFEYEVLFINTVFNSLQIFDEKCASCRSNWYNVESSQRGLERRRVEPEISRRL